MGFMDSFKAAKAAPAKKPGLEVAIGVGKPPMPGADKPDSGSSLSDAQKMAAHALLSAVTSGDADSVGRALKAFVDGEDSGGDEAEADPMMAMGGK